MKNWLKPRKPKHKILWKQSLWACAGDWFEITLTLIHQAFCKHKLEWLHNCFDAQGYALFKSVWFCPKCSRRVEREGFCA